MKKYFSIIILYCGLSFAATDLTPEALQNLKADLNMIYSNMNATDQVRLLQFLQSKASTFTTTIAITDEINRPGIVGIDCEAQLTLKAQDEHNSVVAYSLISTLTAFMRKSTNNVEKYHYLQKSSQDTVNLPETSLVTKMDSSLDTTTLPKHDILRLKSSTETSIPLPKSLILQLIAQNKTQKKQSEEAEETPSNIAEENGKGTKDTEA